jgi:hypothetical protein
MQNSNKHTLGEFAFIIAENNVFTTFVESTCINILHNRFILLQKSRLPIPRFTVFNAELPLKIYLLLLF